MKLSSFHLLSQPQWTFMTSTKNRLQLSNVYVITVEWLPFGTIEVIRSIDDASDVWVWTQKFSLHLKKVMCFHTYSDYQQERTKARKWKIDKWKIIWGDLPREPRGSEGLPYKKGGAARGKFWNWVAAKRYQDPVLWRGLKCFRL